MSNDERKRLVPVVADLEDKAALEQVVEEARSRWGRIDVLVNNAGVFGLSPLESFETDFFECMLRANLAAPMHLVQLCLPDLKKAKGL